ncbi:Terpenoid synthase 19 [Bienertia sinuspersici]
MVIKPWHLDMDLTREVIKTIPIWVKVMVNFKYWGIRALEKILKPVGKLIRVDENTARRDKLQYARVMIEVEVDQAFPDCNGEDRVFSKIDRIMANEDWMDEYEQARAIFLPEGVSDHCPAVIRMGNGQAHGQKPFKYFRMWSQAPDYKERVKRAWHWKGQGTEMYSLTRRLKQVKKELKDLNKNGFSSIQAAATKAYQELTDVQQALYANPRDARLAIVEKEAFNHYKQKQEIYMQFLKQKAKCHWLKEGDSNTKLFYRSIKQRRLQNNVYAIRDMTGELKDSPEDICEAFQQYYAQLLGTSMQDREQVQRIQQRLPTADRLNRWGAQMQATCGLCGTDQESSDHLFFRCSFSREMLEELKSWLNSRNTQQNIKGLCKWINRRSKQAKVERAAWNLVLSAATYLIWQNRNAVQHGKNKQGREHVVAQVKYQVCQRLQLINVTKLSSREQNWIDCLNRS